MTSTHDLDGYLERATTAAKLAGLYLKSQEMNERGVGVHKPGKDFSARSDIGSREIVLKSLGQNLGETIICEEDVRPTKDQVGNIVWFVDPIDGTLNFSRGIGISCVSIGLWIDFYPVLGAIYDFDRDQMYSGIVGKGAFLNEKPIIVSNVESREHAILATGFPSQSDMQTERILEFVNWVQKFKKIRMFGSAAYSLSQVAKGSVDVYRERDIFVWDIAAGISIAVAAGAHFSMTPLSERWTLDLVCGARKSLIA